jgi:hypothetical protein
MRGHTLTLSIPRRQISDLARRWMTGFTVLGIAGRMLRYLLHFPIWEDEAFLSLSLVNRSYADLLQPLAYHQVAPVPYLWLQKTMVDSFGFNEWSLRGLALLAGIAALLVFRRIVDRLLGGWARVAAYGYFAVAYPGLRYAAEAKPYGMDLLMAVLVLWLTVEWVATRRGQWLWLLAVISPVAIAISLPASMVVLAASILIGARLWRPGPAARVATAGDWLAWASMNVTALVAGLAAVAFIRATTEAQLEWARVTWQADFLPVREFWRIPTWFISHIAGGYLAYPFGGPNFGSTLTLIMVSAGLYVLHRRRQYELLWLALAPVAINLFLSALQLYPFGGGVRFSMYEMPMICVACGAGVTALLQSARWLDARRSQMQTLLLCSIVAVAVISMARDVVRPYRTVSDDQARQWAREFWGPSQPSAERIDLKTDLHRDFSPLTFSDLSWSAIYLANIQIYSPRVRDRRAPDWDRISRDWPLTVAEYQDAGKPYDVAARDNWLTEMAQRYTLTTTEDVPMHRYDWTGRKLLTADFVRLYTFTPRQAARAPR